MYTQYIIRMYTKTVCQVETRRDAVTVEGERDR